MTGLQISAAQAAVEIAAAENRIVWRIEAVPSRVDARLGDNRIRLDALADHGGGISVVVEAQAAFALEVEAGFTVFYESVPAGRTAYLLTYLDRTDVHQV
ncbi:MAG: hypothetical protein WAV70_09650 [Anaerolineae bacterium]